MKFLVIGGGASEHAIADALIAGGAEVYAYMATHNPGIIRSAKEYAIGRMDDTKTAVRFAKEKGIEITVIGPEAPLAAGMADELESNGVKCVGPDREHARLETSKGFTRRLLRKHNIDASPKFRIFEGNSVNEIKGFLEELGSYVIKPDGLTGGKGVKISGEHLQSNEEALSYCSEILKAHNAVIVEEKLEGEEFSLQTLTDGNSFLHFPIAQDHKRAFENDTGANTGGMGSYSDADGKLPFLTAKDVEEARRLTELAAEAIRKETGKPYKGVMYGGFMKTATGIKLIEYNARFGDPEAMNVLPILKTSFAEVCRAAAEGRLSGLKAEFERKATVCKYVVPEGYPENPQTGAITVPSYEKDGIRALVYYGSVEQKNGTIHTTKSRSVAFVGIADTIEEAEKTAEEGASKVKGKVYHRKDIGTKQLLQKRTEHMKMVMSKSR